MNESNKSPWVVETTDETFQQDVIDRSSQVPVVVDFWAEWCQPCRQLGPILEQLADEFNGQFELVKANTETAPVAAANFRVQSIPAVYGLRDGRIVDGFIGAMPPDQIRTWIERLLPTEAEQRLVEAQTLRESDPAAAEAKFRAACAAEPNASAATIALSDFLLSQNRSDEARQLIETLEQRGFLEPEAERVKAALELHAQGEAVGDLETCRAMAAAHPDDLEQQLRFARALAAHQQFKAALEVGLVVVQQDHGELREQARQLMVDVFRLMPEDEEVVGEFRRKLSMALF